MATMRRIRRKMRHRTDVLLAPSNDVATTFPPSKIFNLRISIGSASWELQRNANIADGGRCRREGRSRTIRIVPQRCGCSQSILHTTCMAWAVSLSCPLSSSGAGAAQLRADQMCAPKFCVGSNSGPRRPVGTAAAPAVRARKRPEPGAARKAPSSTTMRPRLTTVTGQPVTVRPS